MARKLVLGGISRAVTMRAPDPGTAIPPSTGAPPAVFPVAVTPQQHALAPIPLNDRFPIVIGQALSFSYLASCMRLATSGYPMQLMDLANEILEGDPHILSITSKRNRAVANGRVELVAPKLPTGHKDIARAQEILEFCQAEFDRIPDLSGALSLLLWAVYYGLGASEIFWTRDDKGWHVDRLGFIHRRRLAYPDYQSWDLRIWDQGQVMGWDVSWTNSETNSKLFGLRIADWPGKFIVFAPNVRGDYPTREGLARNIMAFAIAKRLGVRATLEYVERFSKGFFDVEYATKDDGVPREASKEDIALASQIAAAIGPGSGSYGHHPDSIKINPKSFDSGQPKIRYEDLVNICDAQMSKAVLGGSLGTDAGKGSGGNRSLGEVQERAETDLEQADATTLGEALKRDLVSWIVRLNFPKDVHLTPNVNIHVDTDPAPAVLIKDASDMTNLGAAVDLEKLSERTGVPLVPNTNKDADGNIVPRRSRKVDIYAAIKGATAADIPVAYDKLGDELGLPIVPEAEMEKARRTRVVAAGKDTPIEPAGDDPNAPTETSLAPGGDVPVADDAKSSPSDDNAPKPPKGDAKKKLPPKGAATSVKGETEPTNKKDGS